MNKKKIVEMVVLGLITLCVAVILVHFGATVKAKLQMYSEKQYIQYEEYLEDELVPTGPGK